MKRIIPMLLCGLILLCGCESGDNSPIVTYDPPEITIWTGEVTEAAASETEATSETEPNGPTEPQVPAFEQIAAGEYPNDPEEFSKLLEFEDGMTDGNAEKSDAREEYSGSGFVRRLTDGVVTLTVEMPSAQHYRLTLRAAAEQPLCGSLTINGAVRGQFELAGSGEFETVLFDNIYLPEGVSEISVADLTADLDLDCVLIENTETGLTYETDGGLITEKPADSAEALYQYILDNYGRMTLSGQQCAQGSNAELEAIYQTTGKYPAIRFGELCEYANGVDSGDIELAIEWSKAGGIVGYSWNWELNGSVYLGDGGFDLTQAVTDLDVALMDGGALTLRYEAEELSAETLKIIDGIDLVAAQLKRLRDEDIAVLLRPLPEAGSGMFWWSADPDSYFWLYKLIVERMTLYHGLDNIIWVWNGQSTEFYIGDEWCDIISLDIYHPEGSRISTLSGVNFMIAAREFTQNKPIAISEGSALPNPEYLAMDNCRWSFCSVWCGDYVLGEEGTLSQKYMSPGDWIQFYNSDIVVTLDEIEYVQ